MAQVIIQQISEPAKDWAAVAGAAGVPAAAWLTDLNAYLTTLSLLVALALGVARLWLFVKRMRSRSGN